MFNRRLQKLKETLIKQKLKTALVGDVANITYLTGYNNFSHQEREAYLLIGQDFEYLITDARYSEAVRKQVPHFLLFEKSLKNPTEKLFKNLKTQIKTLGVEENVLTVAEYKLLKKHFKSLKHFNADKLRAFKDTKEIANIKTACQLGDLAFRYILKKIKLGVSEKEIADQLAVFIRSKGAELSFPAIVAFGRNSAIPHHQTGNAQLTTGEIILLDFGVKLENYCSDMTRTIFFGSSPAEKQRKIYKTVLEAQNKAVHFINDCLKMNKKIKASDVDQVARKYIKSKGYPDIPHSLGHGIGLEVHEYPSLSPKSREVLKEGMVFSIEPGIYIKSFGGVRIEDLFVIENNTLRQLTSAPTPSPILPSY